MPSAMVVEDEPLLREVFECLLTLRGYTVRTAADGAEALRLLQVEHPQLMLLDNHMPNMTGLEVLQHLHVSAPEIAVILMSADLDADTRRTARALGALACLDKPLEVPELEQYLTARQPDARKRAA